VKRSARERFGRLMAFLFVWQFVLSGPLEIASGYIGFSAYAGYIWKGLTRAESIALITAVGLVNIVLLYRRITSIATITVLLWSGTLVTVLAVIVAGGTHFDPGIAFDFPPGAFNFSLASSSDSAQRRALGSTTTSAITTSATSATKCAILGVSSHGRS
jgi:hypothetical protein